MVGIRLRDLCAQSVCTILKGPRVPVSLLSFLVVLCIICYRKEKKRINILGKTGAQSVVKEIKQYQKKWLQHVQRMDTIRLPKQALQYRRKDEGTRNDQGRGGGTNFILRIKEQDNTPNPSGS